MRKILIILFICLFLVSGCTSKKEPNNTKSKDDKQSTVVENSNSINSNEGITDNKKEKESDSNDIQNDDNKIIDNAQINTKENNNNDNHENATNNNSNNNSYGKEIDEGGIY